VVVPDDRLEQSHLSGPDDDRPIVEGHGHVLIDLRIDQDLGAHRLTDEGEARWWAVHPDTVLLDANDDQAGVDVSINALTDQLGEDGGVEDGLVKSIRGHVTTRVGDALPNERKALLWWQEWCALIDPRHHSGSSVAPDAEPSPAAVGEEHSGNF
jgi:hypothetical protein